MLYFSVLWVLKYIDDSIVGQLTTPEHPRDVAGAAKGSTCYHIDLIGDNDDIDDFFEEEHLPGPKTSAGPRAQSPSGRL